MRKKYSYTTISSTSQLISSYSLKLRKMDGFRLILKLTHLDVNLWIFQWKEHHCGQIKISLRLIKNLINFYLTFINQVARICWLYYLSKFTDFFETVIFVMMKKFDMINLYHVAHHSIMPVYNQHNALLLNLMINDTFSSIILLQVSVWWGVKFLSGGN